MYPYVYEQTLDNASQNRLGFYRSFKYFNKLLSGNVDEPSISNYSDAVFDPNSINKKQQHSVARGLFCANRECCSLILDPQGRSPYCCKQC